LGEGSRIFVVVFTHFRSCWRNHGRVGTGIYSEIVLFEKS